MISITLTVLLWAFQGSAGDDGPGFEMALTDQYGSVVRYPLVGPGDEGTVVLVAVADRRGAEGNVAWAEALAARYRSHLEGRIEPRLVVLPVAHLRSVPKPLRGLVRRAFRRSRVEDQALLPIALDWTGQVERQLGLAPGVPNVAVLDGAGRVVIQRAGAVELEGKAVFEALDRLLSVPPESPDS